jgi:hypothetical protein
MPANHLLTAEIDAVTIHLRSARLPVGATSSMSEDEVRAWMTAHPGKQTVRVHIRCPGAPRPAPYDVDVSDLLFALEPE